MRILKRNLAFMLAMIMALSLTAFAGYEDYPDVDELTYVEAVDVLTELGIVEGSNGELLPTGNLTRAQAAKLIAYTMLGKKAADALQADVAPFVDVPAYHWAAGYVEYCADQGIVGGMGDGTFAPEQNVTASQFAKMLLCAVGYGEKGEFTGLSWDSTVNSQATKLGVFDGNLDVVFADDVTREEAFLYTFNALTKVMSVTYSADADEYYAGTVFNSIKGFDFDETLGAKLYDLNTRDGEDAFGREGYFWYKNNKKITGLYTDGADATYTASVKSGTMYTDLDLDKTTNATVIKNGEKLADKYQIKKGLNGSAYTTGTVLDAGNGVLVEAYVDEDMNVTLIVIDTYLAIVEDVLDDEVDFTVYMENGDEVTVNNHETTMDLVEDDYVLVTMVDGAIETIIVPETVNGELDAHGVNSNYTMMDDEKYSHSENLDQHDVETYDPEYDTEMIMMLDEYGYMIGLVQAEEAGKLDGYVLLTDSEFEVGGLAANGKALVEVLHLDGTGYEVLSLDTKRSGSGLNRVTKYLHPNGTWMVLEDGYELNYGFYGYYMTEDDEIVLLNLADTNPSEAQLTAQTIESDSLNENDNTDAYANADAYIAANAIVGDGQTNSVLKAEGKQQFVFGNDLKNLVLDNNSNLHLVTADDVETVTGYKNIKIDETAVDALVIYKGRTVSDIYVVDGSMLDDDIYAYYNGTEFRVVGSKLYAPLYVEGNLEYYLYANKVNGTWVPVVTITDHAGDNRDYTRKVAGWNSYADIEDGIYMIELEGNELVKMEFVMDEGYKGTVVDTDDTWFDFEHGTFTQLDDVLVTYADGVEIYDFDGDETELTKGDTVIYLVNDYNKGEVATHIWILSHNSGTVVGPDGGDSDLSIVNKNGQYIRMAVSNILSDADAAKLTVDVYALGGGLLDDDVAMHSAWTEVGTTNVYEGVIKSNVKGDLFFKVYLDGVLVGTTQVLTFNW